ncbi:MAG: peptidoglycan-associated lipoprotein Pal [Gammaproteobacteria bacterium]|nr:peptidoglycan-associated lipoprotein Pal [Gammaproteobacteria bacterium]
MRNKLKLIKLTLLALVAMSIIGCQTTGQEMETDPSMVDGQSQIDGSGAGSDLSGSDASSFDGSDDTSLIPIVEETMTAQEMLDDPGSQLANRTIYFDFDSAKITDDSLALLEAHGNFIAGNGDVSVRIEGHADERGSREYNIALGDRRAQSVRRVLLFQGASVDQLDTISYGEEQPAMLGHNEDAWSRNRRVELVYNVN